MVPNRPDELESIVITGGDDWTVEELTEFLGHLYVLYNRISVLKEKRRKKPASIARQMYASKSRVPLKKKMKVESLTIQSPMTINLLGIGEIVRQVRKGVKDFYRNPRERERLDEELRHEGEMNRIKEAAAKIELIRSANETLEEIGIPDDDRIASLRALASPASDAAEIVKRKKLRID